MVSKYYLIIIGIILAVAALIVGGYVRINPKNLSPIPNVSNQVKMGNIQAGAVVAISKDGLIPQTISVKKGSRVQFINQDSAPHQIASDPHPTHTLYPFLNTSEPLSPGESVTIIFEKSGTFTYHDHLNPLKYKGVVIVQ